MPGGAHQPGPAAGSGEPAGELDRFPRRPAAGPLPARLWRPAACAADAAAAAGQDFMKLALGEDAAE